MPFLQDANLGVKVFTAVLFVFILTTIIVVEKIFEERVQKSVKASQIYFSDEHRFYNLMNRDGDIVLKGFFGKNIPHDLLPDVCKTPSSASTTRLKSSSHVRFIPFKSENDSGYSVYGLSSSTKYCRDWKYRAHLDINFEKKQDNVSCYHFHWSGVSEDVPLKDCFDISSAYWFGMGHVKEGKWPLNGLSMNSTPFVTSHDPKQFNFGSIIKRYYLSSSGVAIHVPLSVPLFVSFNSTSDLNKRGDSMLCFEARPSTQPYFTPSFPSPKLLPHLDYSICVGSNMYSLHQVVFKDWTKNPDDKTVQRTQDRKTTISTTTSFPETTMTNNFTQENASLLVSSVPLQNVTTSKQESHLMKPKDHSSELIQNIIWTTDGSVSFDDLSDSSIFAFMDSIVNNGHKPAFLLIDDRWERRVGELVANESSFSSLPSFYYYIKTKKFKPILSVSPFIGIGNPIIEDASREQRFFVDPKLRVPLLTKCFRGQKQDLCALIDVSNSTSRQWFWDRFRERVFDKHHFYGLYFAGVQVSMMPRRLVPPEVTGAINPDYFQVFYSSLSKRVSTLTGFDVAVGHQKSNSIFYRLLPRTSSWESLREIIPTSLSVSLIGYNLINPGSVGGDIGLNLETFDKNLYMRWMQLSMFLPVVQFSDPPAVISNNDTQVIRCFQRLYSIRKSLVEAALMEALRENSNNSYPVIRGMNFLAPGISASYRINDQFSIGNDIVVAPVLDKDADTRMIFLPPGKWKPRSNRKRILEGNTWLQDYPVAWDEIAYFVRVSDEEVNHPDSIEDSDDGDEW